MTVKECYEQIGGNYEDAIRRLMNDNMIIKFAGKFLENDCYQGLVDAMENEDYEEAFKMAHTLKGVCQNLSYTALGDKGDELTEALREKNRDIALAKKLYEEILVEYGRTVGGLKQLL